MGENLKTSVRVLGARQVDEFQALCVLLRRRPHELAADFVLEGIRRARQDPDLAEAVAAMVAAREAHRREERSEVVRHASGLRLLRGGDS